MSLLSTATMDYSDISQFAANDTKTYTRWLLACRALHTNPTEAGERTLPSIYPRKNYVNHSVVNTTRFLNLLDSLLPLAWRIHWDRQMPLQTTRVLNCFIREIAGLDLSLRISFAQYPRVDQRRAIG
jgi:hypothetical protein